MEHIKEKVDKFLSENDGSVFSIVNTFPFNEEERSIIRNGFSDSTLSDEDMEQLILDLAYRHKD